MAEVSFTGIESTIGAEFALSRGVTPSICTLYMLPQDVLDLPPGTLTFTDEDSISFTGCAVEAGVFRQRWDGTAWRWSIQILDRRRTWKSATVSGEYNLRLSNGDIISATRKSAQELMTLCLNACGEATADVSQAPENVFPYVRWRDARADLALADLCERTACEVCPTGDDQFAVCALGLGQDLESLDTQKHTPVRYFPRSAPSVLRVVGGPSWFQTKLLLQPVVEEAGSDQKLLTTVSWRPDTPTYESPFTWPNESGNDQRAALETGYRRFRIKEQAGGGLAVPGCEAAVASIAQYLPIAGLLVSSGLDLDLTPRVQRPYIEGDFWPYSDSSESASSLRYTGQFNLLSERGEVEFPAPVFGLSSGTVIDPKLYLTCAYNVTDGDTVRLRRERALDGTGGIEILRRPEIFASFLSAYSGTSLSSTTSTLAIAEAEADAYLDLFARKYADPRCGECTYAGLLAQGLDGKIAQVTWRVGVRMSPSTQVCLNEELNVYAVARRERRRREKLEAV